MEFHNFRGMSSNGGRSNLYSQNGGSSTGWSVLRNEEYQENDIWDIALQEKKEIDYNRESSSSSSSSLISSKRQPNPSATRMIPKSRKNSMDESQKVQQSSAPLNIPDWQKIYGKESFNNIDSWNGEDDSEEEEEEEEEDDDDVSMIPPHEWISRKLARSRISSFSVYEGVGRTLKGRDLSNVRNAVLTKTGFLE